MHYICIYVHALYICICIRNIYIYVYAIYIFICINIFVYALGYCKSGVKDQGKSGLLLSQREVEHAQLEEHGEDVEHEEDMEHEGTLRRCGT